VATQHALGLVIAVHAKLRAIQRQRMAPETQARCGFRVDEHKWIEDRLATYGDLPSGDQVLGFASRYAGLPLNDEKQFFLRLSCVHDTIGIRYLA